MAEVKVPRLPEGAKGATIAQWLVDEGDSIDEGDDLAELEVEGEALNVSAPVAGVVTDVYFDEGDEVEAGEVIAEIEEE